MAALLGNAGIGRQCLMHMLRCKVLSTQVFVYQLRTQNVLSINVRCLSGEISEKNLKTKFHVDNVNNAKTNVSKALPKEQFTLEDESYRERYIPITRRSVIRHLMETDNFLTDNEKKKLEDFAVALDSAIVNKYHGVLNELKTLFDPINPDKDTIQTRQWTPQERQDNEFWLLQRLEDIMERANFHELPKAVVEKAMEEHEVMDGVTVRVDRSKYEVLRFWALGRETEPKETPPWYQTLFWKDAIQPKPRKYYKRVVVAIRMKRDQKLILKSFKEVPVNSLEMLLPDGKLRIGKFDKGLIVTSLTLGGLGLLGKCVTMMAHVDVNWMLFFSGFTTLIAVRGWTMYKNRRNKYLADLSRLLYFKNVANNRGLLALLVDRAEDESFKEALLVYTFLLTRQPSALRTTDVKDSEPADFAGVSSEDLEADVKNWIEKKTKVRVHVDSSEAIAILKGFGILTEKSECLTVLPIEAAVRNLPKQPQSLVARATETDISEGYDRDLLLDTEEQYKREESWLKRFGWF